MEPAPPALQTPAEGEAPAASPEPEAEAEAANEYDVQQGGRLARAIESGTLAVVRASYFEDCLKRQEKFGHRVQLPAEAVFEPADAAEQWYKHCFKFLLVVSYSWLTAEHPDPNLFHLPLLVSVLRAMKAKWDVTPGVILDYASFYQSPRTPEQDLSFKECLSIVNIPYGHRDVTALRLTGTPPDELRGYDVRGWTKFESDIIDSKPPSLHTDGVFMEGELNVLTCAARRAGDGSASHFTDCVRRDRRPLVCPARFERELAERKELAERRGVRLFTNGKDQPTILTKYRESFRQICRSTKMLVYTNMRIGPEGGRIVAEALPQLKHLQTISLSRSGLGAEGAIALAQALPQVEELTRLSLSSNSIGDGGAAALARALPALRKLRGLQLDDNQIGDGGVGALAQALPELEELRELSLFGNNLMGEGAAALARVLPGSGLERLRLGRNFLDFDAAGKEGKMALRKATMGTRVKLEF